MRKYFQLKTLLSTVIIANFLLGCAYPNAITDENRDVPIEGMGIQMMPPQKGSQWRYGFYDDLGLIGFYKFLPGINSGEMFMTVVQSWVVNADYNFNTGQELASRLLLDYKSAGTLNLDIERHEIAKKVIGGESFSMLQLWGRHKKIARVISTRIVRFNAAFYIIPHPDKVLRRWRISWE